MKKPGLTAKQRKFIAEYVKDLDASKAARRAGYSVKMAGQIGWQQLQNPTIRKVIDEKLRAHTMSADEILKLINDMARSNLSDYYTTVKVEHTPRIEKPLKTIIAEKLAQIDFENEYAKEADLSGNELEYHLQSIAQMQREILRYRLELKRNPKATRIVAGPTVLVDEQVLDMKRLIADKERGRIKSIKPNEHGISVELCSAENAILHLAKIHGLFEKDNAQRAATAAVVFIGDEEINPG